MPDVFISYSRVDQNTAKLIAASLEAEGFDVWWDGVLRAGDSYDEVIEENLRNAKAVVVIWSKTSTKSKWVRAEATVGERHSTIVPALIQECDVPIRFELMQTADLTQWDGDRSDSNWQRFVADINAAVKNDNASVGQSENIDDHRRDAPTSNSVEAIFWSTICDTREPAELEAYLRRYKDGQFVDLARQRLDALSLEGKKPAQTSEIPKANIPRPLIALSIFTVATVIGMVMLVLANAIHIGFLTWTPGAGAEQLDTGAKEVGFYHAINWSIATLFLMPAAWTLIYLALASLNDAFGTMIRKKMLVTTDFKPVEAGNIGLKSFQKHLTIFVLGGITIVTTVMIVLSLSDHAQVAGQFYRDVGATVKLDRLDAQGYPLEAANIERDWMVGAFLSTAQPDTVSVTHNNAFALTAYLIYVGIGIGSLFSFGLVMIGVGAAFIRGVAQNYGLQFIPSLVSDDRRCGFEALQRFFGYAFALSLIGCVMIYLMGVQNIYLRSPAPDIFSFLAPDFGALNASSNWRDAIDARIGFLFSDNVAKGTRNVYGWLFGFFIFAVFIGGFMVFLRQGATNGRLQLLSRIEKNGYPSISTLTDKNEDLARAQLASMRVWPLDRMSVRDSLIVIFFLVVSFIFYKLGLLIITALCVAVPMRLKPKGP